MTSDRWSRALVGPFTAAALLGLSAFAVQADESGIPDLQGAWTEVEGQHIHGNGEIKNVPGDDEVLAIEVSKQTGGVFTASQTLRSPDADAQGSGPAPGQPTPMLGVLGLDGHSVVFAGQKDTTVIHCDLIDLDMMHCLVWQAGEDALAGRSILKREGS